MEEIDHRTSSIAERREEPLLEDGNSSFEDFYQGLPGLPGVERAQVRDLLVLQVPEYTTRRRISPEEATQTETATDPESGEGAPQRGRETCSS